MNDEKNFLCGNCGINVSYTYFGKKPNKEEKNLVLLESAYVMNNPFKNEGFLIIGGKCSICEAEVCVDQRCSIFYCKRFCKGCAVDHKNNFPLPVQKDIQRFFSANK